MIDYRFNFTTDTTVTVSVDPEDYGGASPEELYDMALGIAWEDLGNSLVNEHDWEMYSSGFIVDRRGE